MADMLMISISKGGIGKRWVGVGFDRGSATCWKMGVWVRVAEGVIKEKDKSLVADMVNKGEVCVVPLSFEFPLVGPKVDCGVVGVEIGMGRLQGS